MLTAARRTDKHKPRYGTRDAKPRNASREVCACGLRYPPGQNNCLLCGQQRRRHSGQPYPAAEIERYDWVNGQTIGNAHAKAVLLALVSHDRPQSKLGPGIVNPSVKRLMQITELSDSTVRRALGRLQSDGWITSEKRRRGGRQTSSRYTIRQAEGREVPVCHSDSRTDYQSDRP